MLNADLGSTTAEWLRGLAEPVLKDDYGLVLPLYQRYRYDGTLTQALVVPLMRSLFGRQLAQPLAEEFACSAARPPTSSSRSRSGTPTSGGRASSSGCPRAAIEQGLAVGQAALGRRGRPRPRRRPRRSAATVGRVAGALFALAERSESLLARHPRLRAGA